MAADDHYSAAAELLVDEDFMGAVDSFSKALSEDGTLVKALTGRAQAYLKLKRNTEALQVLFAFLPRIYLFLGTLHHPIIFHLWAGCERCTQT